MLAMSASRPLRALLVPVLAAGQILSPVLLAQQPPAEPPVFVESVEVAVVNVDVVVLDKDNRPVVGLAREDFELFVDGRATPLSNFAAYEESAAMAAEELRLETPAPSPEAAAIEVPRAAPPSTWIVYVDQSNLEISPRNQIVKEARDFVATSLKPGDRSMVATFDGRSLKVLSGLSADRQPALDALAKLQKQVGYPSGMRGNASKIQNDIANLNLNSTGITFEAQNIATEIQNLAEQHALRLRGALAAFRDLLAITAGVEGRVAVLYGGGGFEADPTANLYRALQVKMAPLSERRQTMDTGPSPNQDRDPLTTQNKLDYDKLLGDVNASRVTIFSIYGGPKSTTVVTADIGGDPGLSGPSLSIDSAGAASTISAFATETGGRTFVAAPDLAERLDFARQDLSSYYSLGYHPDAKDPGKFHEVEVRVKREGVRVVARRGVQEKAPEQAASDAATAALVSTAPPANPFGARIEVGEAVKGKGKALTVPVLVRVPVRSITLLPAGAVHRAQLLFNFSLRDPDGGYRRLEARPLEFSVPAEKLAGAQGQSIAYKIELKLEPGAYQLAVAVADKIAGATSATTTGFNVAKPR